MVSGARRDLPPFGADADLMAFDEFNELIGVEGKYELARLFAAD